MKFAACAALVAAVALGACATKPKKTVAMLDAADVKFATPDCVEARKAALAHSDHTLLRVGISVASHALLGPLAIPISLASHEQKYDAREKANREVILHCITGGEEIIAEKDAEAKAAQESRDAKLVVQ